LRLGVVRAILSRSFEGLNNIDFHLIKMIQLLLTILKQVITFESFKAHPLERRGRKATGLTPENGQDSGVANQAHP
jgi:hypothetical protein